MHILLLIKKHYDKQTNDNIFCIDYSNKEEWKNVFSHFSKVTKLRIVVLPPTKENYSPENLMHIYYVLATALVKINFTAEVLILSVKNSTDELEKIHHSFHGLFRTLSMECVNLSVILIEKDKIEHNDFLTVGGLHCDISKNHKFSRLLLSEGEISRYSLQEESVSLSFSFQRLKNEGVYLITGGMGSVGLFVAKFLRKKYAAKLILMGRSEISQEKMRNVFGSLYDDSNIIYMSADINSLEQVQKAIEESWHHFGVINGVIHAAGQTHDVLFSEKDESEFLSTVTVKAKGAENLDICTKDMLLDFFVCFSSLVTITGNVGQADYITGNNYLDLFARVRNEQTRNHQRFGHTISINWPLWINHKERYSILENYLKETFGIDILSENLGVELFDLIVNCASENVDQIIPLPGKISLEHFLEYSANSHEEKHEKITKSSSPEQHPTVVNFEAIVSFVKQITKDDSEINLNVSFGEIGLNSIMLQELAQKISDKYSLSVPVLVLFKYNSVSKITSYLNEKLKRKITEKPTNFAYVNKNNVADKRIAIIGMSGRMPGADNLEEYWQNLIKNKNAIVPLDRWKNRKYFGGIIKGYDLFDPRFFNISMREAVLLDPQQRVFLECSYNTILDAGYRPSELTKVGVFVGAQFNDYKNLLFKSEVSHHPFVAIGNSNNMISNRVSFFFNFNGPSQTIDTACSSAIVAIHRAVESLFCGECNYVLAGAVNLLIDPETTDAANSMGVLSPHYRCATFDESADGYVRSEGVGCVLLKRYSEAVADGDSIYGIIESVREGHGGHSNSLTAPNQDAQTKLIVSTYVDDLAKKVSYLETHGTGTKLGDPIEVDALKSAWEKLEANNGNHPVYLGAVKSAVGHLEPAAGMASLFKIILAMKHKMLPANQNFNKLNTFINFSGTNFQLLTENISWNSDSPLVAGMSCFGFGGSNTHMVLSEYRPLFSENVANSSSKPNLFTISAKSKESLQAIIENLIRYLSSDGFNESFFSDVSFTLNVGRDHFQYRVAIVAGNTKELLEKLKTLTKFDFTKIDINIMSSYDSFVSSDDVLVCQREYLSGKEMDWKALYINEKHHRLHLPGYVFEKKQCWFEEKNKHE